MIRSAAAAFACLLVVTAAAPPARADVLILIDKASQRMAVTVDGVTLHVFKTSTGIYGSGTPVGLYPVERMHRSWYSRKYDNAPMPHALFFYGAYAIHGSTVISRLGNPASHGCVRLHPNDAEVLFNLVRGEGMGSTMIAVVGENPRPAQAAVSTRRRERTSPRPLRPVRGDPAADHARSLWENRR